MSRWCLVFALCGALSACGDGGKGSGGWLDHGAIDDVPDAGPETGEPSPQDDEPTVETREPRVVVYAASGDEDEATLALGETLQLEAEYIGADDYAQDDALIDWLSKDVAVASVSSTGLVTPHAVGDVQIRATAHGVTGALVVHVTPAPVERVTLEPAELKLDAVGDTAKVSVRAFDTLGAELEVRPSDLFWSRALPLVGSVEGDTVTAHNRGATMISVSYEGVVASARLVVGDLLPGTPGFAFKEIAAGEDHTCGVATDGKTYCWGSNFQGQLGTGEGPYANAQIPALVEGGHTFHGLSGWHDHTCALDESGAAFCWGSNGYGQLGNDSSTDSAVPVAVAGGLAFTQITVGYWHTCALTAAGRAYCFGLNQGGVLGTGHEESADTPTPVAGGLVFKEIRAGGIYTCGLTSEGAAYCWGAILGVDPNADGGKPAAVVGHHVFEHLDLREDHACGNTADGKVYCWGNNSTGQAGEFGSQYEPGLVQSDQKFIDVRVGAGFSCARTELGAIWCWGSNTDGQLGDGTTISHDRPVKVAGDLTFASFTVGGGHACALTTESEAHCWGVGNDGKLATGVPTEYSIVPWPVAAPQAP